VAVEDEALPEVAEVEAIDEVLPPDGLDAQAQPNTVVIATAV
jgi:hypothetical protein